ncbi:hypothetical protein BgiMline_027920, partial [Biomphalaria glabrata]
MMYPFEVPGWKCTFNYLNSDDNLYRLLVNLRVQDHDIESQDIQKGCNDTMWQAPN